MSSRDDPFGDGKTVIGRSRPSERRAPNRSGVDQIAPKPEATIFDPGFAEQRIAGWNEPAKPGRSDSARPDWRTLEEASKRIASRSDNPMIAAAGPLLILLGQLRQSPPEVDPNVLADHFAQLIDDFELTVTRNGVDESDARVARYVLCEMVDDTLQSLPDVGPEGWMPIGMLSRFFRADAAGSGFFDALNRALGNPEPHCDLIELMHACLALGFEGQYRGVENGSSRLAQVRNDAYQVLRYCRPRPAQELSPQWHPVVLKGQHRRAGVPVWVAAALGCAIVAGAFLAARDRIAQQGEAVAAEILAMTPSTPAAIRHAAFVPIFRDQPPETETAARPEPSAPAPPQVDAQLDRVRAALAQPIDAGKLTVSTKGAFIVIEIGNQQLFQPGKAVLKPEFEALVGPITAVLSAERGPIKIVGHTDSDKPGRASAFKSNYDLSVARAKAVEKRLKSALADNVTLEVEGRGEDEPIADNKTAEGKARNRRVDLLITREQGA